MMVKQVAHMAWHIGVDDWELQTWLRAASSRQSRGKKSLNLHDHSCRRQDARRGAGRRAQRGGNGGTFPVSVQAKNLPAIDIIDLSVPDNKVTHTHDVDVTTKATVALPFSLAPVSAALSTCPTAKESIDPHPQQDVQQDTASSFCAGVPTAATAPVISTELDPGAVNPRECKPKFWNKNFVKSPTRARHGVHPPAKRKGGNNNNKIRLLWNKTFSKSPTTKRKGISINKYNGLGLPASSNSCILCLRQFASKQALVCRYSNSKCGDHLRKVISPLRDTALEKEQKTPAKKRSKRSRICAIPDKKSVSIAHGAPCPETKTGKWDNLPVIAAKRSRS